MNPHDTVSLCLIVRNEEKCLARCLESFRGVVDEICILDTGSTDQTVEIAGIFGAKLKFFEWNDNFSEARNRNLEMATMDWIMVADADEYLRREDMQTLRQALKLKQYDGFLIKTLNFNQEGSQQHIVNLNQRIFKNNGNFHYQGRIHEQVVCIDPAKKGEGFVAIDVGFYHTGYLRSEREEKQKNQRNLAILRKAAEEEPETMFSLFNLANEFNNDPDKHHEALDLYHRAYAYRAFDAGFMPKLIMFRLLALIREQLWDEALAAITDGLSAYPDFTDLVYQRGIVEKKKGLILKAIGSFEMCLTMGKPRAALEFSTQSYGYGAHFHLAEIYKQQEAFAKAFTHYQESLRLEKSKYELLYPMFDCLVRLEDDRKKVAAVMKCFFNLQDDLNRVVYVNLLLDKEFYQEAVEFLSESGVWESENIRQQLKGRAQAELVLDRDI